MTDEPTQTFTDMIAGLARDNRSAAHRAAHAILMKIEMLQRSGHAVAMTGDIPGLWRVDNGPEITTNQLLSL